MTDPRTAELIQRYLDGVITKPELAELNAALAADPAARRAFIKASYQARLIAENLTDAVALTPKPDDGKKETGDRAQETVPISAAGVPMYRKGYEPQPFKLRAHHIALTAATLLAACGLAAYLLTTSVDPEPSPPEPSSPPPVATLIQNTGNLRTPHGYPAEGSDYPRGEYVLSGGGTAEFMLTNSVNVKLRGETRMHMRNNMNVALTRGSAEFVVPKDATGFTVHLPDETKIVDLGTAFDIEIDNNGEPRFRVSEGRVQWVAAVPGALPVLVEAGQIFRIVEGRRLVAPEAFVATDFNEGGLDTGFVGDWTGSSNVFVKDAPDLTYARYRITQTGTTPRVYVSNAAPDRQDVRQLETALSGDIWFSVLVHVPAGSGYAGLTFNSSGDDYDPIASAARVLMGPNKLHVGFDGGATSATTREFEADTTHLLLGKMRVVAGDDMLSVWVDPDLSDAASPDDLPTADLTTAAVDFANAITHVGVAGRDGAGVDVAIDAIRLSNSASAFQDVTGVATPPASPQTQHRQRVGEDESNK